MKKLYVPALSNTVTTKYLLDGRLKTEQGKTELDIKNGTKYPPLKIKK